MGANKSTYCFTLLLIGFFTLVTKTNIAHSQNEGSLDEVQEQEVDQYGRERRFLKLSPLKPNTGLQLDLPIFRALVPPPRPNCKPYSYEDCERHHDTCKQCYNCTCIPILPKENNVMEVVSKQLATFECPKHYDPIIRQEPAVEPRSYTHMTPHHYHHLSLLLSRSSSITPAFEGNFVSPPPSRQTKEIIQLVIELFEKRRNVAHYRSSLIFENPRDWMQLINYDPSANRIQRHQYAEILSLDEVQQLIKANKPKEPIVFPPRRPDPRYQIVDEISRFYDFEKKNFPIARMLQPLYGVLTWQAQQEVQAENMRQRFVNDLRAVARAVPRIEQPLVQLPRQGRCVNYSTALVLEEDQIIDDEWLFDRYNAILLNLDK